MCVNTVKAKWVHVSLLKNAGHLGIMKPKGIIAAKAGGLRNKPRHLSPHLGLGEKGRKGREILGKLTLELNGCELRGSTYRNLLHKGQP